jgi:aromatic ring-opening dioxygenase catalytic subunit (LigB family)
VPGTSDGDRTDLLRNRDGNRPSIAVSGEEAGAIAAHPRTLFPGGASEAHRGAGAPPLEPRVSARLPVAYLPHGGGPWPFVDLGLDPAETSALSAFLRSVPARAPAAVRAVLLVTAHWEEAVPTVSSHPRPGLLYDYSGFPPAAYQLSWAAEGAPALAAEVRALLAAAGLPHADDPHRGFDHGTFVPLMVAWPRGEVPVVQLSLVRGLAPAAHRAIGAALAPLRDRGVYILGSGLSFHNLRALRNPAAGPPAAAFDAWLRDTIESPAPARDARLDAWADAPSARFCHPREEHLLPLHVVAGAAGPDRGRVSWAGRFMGLPVLAASFGEERATEGEQAS